MSRSILTPLQLTAASSLLNNQGLQSLPASLVSALAAFNSTPVIAAFNSAVASYLSKSFATDPTLTALLTVGNSTCPALGNSIPVPPLGDFPNLAYPTTDQGRIVVRTLPRSPYGFSGLIEQTGNAYLGNGDAGKFAQGFQAVQGFVSTTNDFINSAANANQYLGPTFRGMDALASFDVATVSADIVGFGVDIQKQGSLWDLGNLDLYGTPAGLLQQIAAQGNITASSTPALVSAMQAVGMSTQDIADLVNNNRQSLFNPNGLTANQFDRLQKLAYSAMTLVSDDDLEQVLELLDVTTPNISSLTDLFDPVKTFPISYQSLQTPSPNGPVKIYTPQGSINAGIQPIVNAYLPIQTGCDELGKIIPPAAAVADKAIEVALKQISGIENTTLPELADVIKGTADREWSPEQFYLANDLVNNPNAIAQCEPDTYRAQKNVPPGIDISDTEYWQPTTLCAVNTMQGLPDIETLTTPVPQSVTTFFDNSIATGSGPGDTITIYDVIGTAVDRNNIAGRLTRCTEIIDALDALGALTNLTNAYTGIVTAGNDAAVSGFITTANTEIGTVAAAYPAEVSELNELFAEIADSLNKELSLQIRAGLDYFELLPGDQLSAMSFVQSLPEYAELTAAGQAAEFLEEIADTSSVGGQALIGSMREARNSDCLESAGLFGANQIPADPVVEPTPVVLPTPLTSPTCPI